MDCFYTAKVFLLKLNIEHDALLNTVLVAFKQRRCFSERIGDERDPPRRVLVAFKQRRCFSQPADPHAAGEPEENPGCWSLSNSEGVSPETGSSSDLESSGCWSLSNSEGVSPETGSSSDLESSGCWSLSNSEGVSPMYGADILTDGTRGVGRFQTAKVFLRR